MNLHLIEVPIELRGLHRWAEQRQLARRGVDEGLVLHHMLSETFGPSCLQPFRLMVAPRAIKGSLYAYSELSAERLRESVAPVISPTVIEVLKLNRLRSVPRPKVIWKKGMRLGFDLKARPVVRLASPIEGKNGSFSRGAEIDAYLAKALRNDDARQRDEVYIDWLRERLAPAAEIEHETTRLHSYRRQRVMRGQRQVEGPDAIFHGTITVRDASEFATLVEKGVGRHRAYGYGMLLLRPTQSRR